MRMCVPIFYDNGRSRTGTGSLTSERCVRRSLHPVVAIAFCISASACGARPAFEGKSVAELEQMLGDADPKLQAAAAHGLSLKGADAAPAVPSLIKALE